MSVVIRVSEDVATYIKKHGRFPENYSDVLERRLIDFKPSPSNGKPVKTKRFQPRKATEKGRFTSKETFERLILISLMLTDDKELSCSETTLRIGALAKLKPMDVEKVAKGELRWRNKVRWARNTLVETGLLYTKEESGRGNWRLTEKGIDKAGKILQQT